ncbi:MAG: NADH dehydrogenase, partial [Thiotrichales bacterium SG8_50]
MSRPAEMSKTDLLSTEVKAGIDKWVAKYPTERKSSAVMAALRLAQDANGGWLNQELIEAVALYLDMPPIA